MQRGTLRRRICVVYWRIANPLAGPIAGFAPWWVLLETTGWRTGRRRRTPLAAGPLDRESTWLIAVHGRHSGWVRNLEAAPAVRVKHLGRWRHGTSSIEQFDHEQLKRFNPYARSGPRIVGIDPVLVRITFTDGPQQGTPSAEAG